MALFFGYKVAVAIQRCSKTQACAFGCWICRSYLPISNMATWYLSAEPLCHFLCLPTFRHVARYLSLSQWNMVRTGGPFGFVIAPPHFPKNPKSIFNFLLQQNDFVVCSGLPSHTKKNCCPRAPLGKQHNTVFNVVPLEAEDFSGVCMMLQLNSSMQPWFLIGILPCERVVFQEISTLCSGILPLERAHALKLGPKSEHEYPSRDCGHRLQTIHRNFF